MKLRWSIAALILLPVLTIGHPVRTVSERGDAGPKSPVAAYGRLPFSFEINQGQSDPRVKFLSRGPDYTLFLTPQETVLSLRRPHPRAAAIVAVDHRQQTPDAPPTETAVVRMQFVGANPQPAVTGVDPLPGKSHYFIGNDPEQWHTNIAQYAKVRYQALYPGIDLIYYGAPRRLEYDLVVAPGADPRAIRLAFRGVEALRLDDQGDLILQTPTGEVIQHQPVIYQEREGRREPRSGHYRLVTADTGFSDGWREVAIEVAAYDSTRPLIIDPVLSYSTYLGGSGDDRVSGIAVDNNGSAFVSGHTDSTDFPPPSPTVFPSCANDFPPCPGVLPGDYAFVARLDAFGTSVTYLTYLGGNGSMNQANGIVIDGGSHAYVTGVTNSIDFPVLDPVQSSYGGGASDAFATKLSDDGSALELSTYLGGTAADRGNGIGVDSSHNIYVTGVTTSTDFPMMSGVVSKPPLQSTNGGGSDAFVTKLKSTGTKMIYSTYVGGSGEDQATAIAVDGGGIAYLTGYTDSPDFPLSSKPLQPSLKGVGTHDAFVSKLSAAGDAYLYSTYLGGSGDDKAYGIALDSGGGAVVTGETASVDFPLKLNPTPLQPSYGGGTSDAFVSRLNSAGDGFVYSTYLGGSDADVGYSVTVGSENAAYVTGTTVSAGLPPGGFPTTPDAFQLNNGGGRDAFVTELASNGQLTYSTYLGGDGADIGHAIGLDITDNIYLAGETDSTNFPVMQLPIQTGPANGVDAFVTKIDNSTASSGCNFSPKGRPDWGLPLLLSLAALYGLRRRILSARASHSL
jgi:hypothetical protein